MTEEELTRFAQVLREADRIRRQISKDEAAASADGHSELQPSSVEGERILEPAA